VSSDGKKADEENNRYARNTETRCIDSGLRLGREEDLGEGRAGRHRKANLDRRRGYKVDPRTPDNRQPTWQGRQDHTLHGREAVCRPTGADPRRTVATSACSAQPSRRCP